MPATDTRGNASAIPVPLWPLIEGPAAWVGSDMREREAEWSYRLSTAEIAEVETAVKRVRASGLDIAEIRREDFPLPPVDRKRLIQTRHQVGPTLRHHVVHSHRAHDRRQSARLCAPQAQ